MRKPTVVEMNMIDNALQGMDLANAHEPDIHSNQATGAYGAFRTALVRVTTTIWGDNEEIAKYIEDYPWGDSWNAGVWTAYMNRKVAAAHPYVKEVRERALVDSWRGWDPLVHLDEVELMTILASSETLREALSRADVWASGYRAGLKQAQ